MRGWLQCANERVIHASLLGGYYQHRIFLSHQKFLFLFFYLLFIEYWMNYKLLIMLWSSTNLYILNTLLIAVKKMMSTSFPIALIHSMAQTFFHVVLVSQFFVEFIHFSSEAPSQTIRSPNLTCFVTQTPEVKAPHTTAVVTTICYLFFIFKVHC